MYALCRFAPVQGFFKYEKRASPKGEARKYNVLFPAGSAICRLCFGMLL